MGRRLANNSAGPGDVRLANTDAAAIGRMQGSEFYANFIGLWEPLSTPSSQKLVRIRVADGFSVKRFSRKLKHRQLRRNLQTGSSSTAIKPQVVYAKGIEGVGGVLAD